MKIGTRSERPAPAFQEPAAIDDGLASGDGDLPDVASFSAIALLPYWLMLALLAMINPATLPWLGWVGQGLPFFLLYVSGFALPQLWPSRMRPGIYVFGVLACLAMLSVLTILFIGAALGLFVLADRFGIQGSLAAWHIQRFTVILFAVFGATIASRLVARLHATFLGLSPEDVEAQTLRLGHTMAGIFMAAILGMICLPDFNGLVLQQVSPLTALLALAIAPLPYPVCLWFALRGIGFGPSRVPSWLVWVILILSLWVIGIFVSYLRQQAAGDGITPFGTLVWPYQAVVMMGGFDS